MLGINGQSKGLSKRGAVVKKGPDKATAGKLPAVARPANEPSKSSNKKPASKGKSGAVEKSKEGATESSVGVSKPKLASGSIAEPMCENVLEIAKMQLSLQPGEHCGTVKVRFNHYNKSFPIYNGVLQWADVDEEYCLSFVYRGNYGRELVLLPFDSSNTRTEARIVVRHDDAHMYYIDMRANSEYRLEVTEDPLAGIGAEGLRLNTGPLKSAELSSIQSSQKVIKSTTVAMDTITAELKSIAVTDLSSAHAKDLIERRDLEDILYSG